jgi:hypothetical protein
VCSADLSIGENLTVHFSAAHEYSSREDGNPGQDPTDVHGGNPALRIEINNSERKGITKLFFTVLVQRYNGTTAGLGNLELKCVHRTAKKIAPK